jgi:RNA 3'-terminal phosphate cyclase (ATP)
MHAEHGQGEHVKPGIVRIDGSMGEGGGQVLRSALTLSLLTGRELSMTRIRAGRKKPGLMRQHLTALRAAVEVSGARAEGASPGSTELRFVPGAVRAGRYVFSVGTAGSATLVLQTVLPALMMAGSASSLTLEGGTHNPFAPPFDFLERTFLPCLEKMGPKVTCTLLQPGYYPAGGGRFTVEVEPVERLTPLAINERGELKEKSARAVVSRLSPGIARRELAVVQKLLGWPEEALVSVEEHRATGPGNYLALELAYENITEVFSGFGQRGVRAEDVAARVVREAREYLATDAPVCRHLADQVLLPMAMAGAGSFRTLSPSEHTLTNREVIRSFLDVEIRCERMDERRWQVSVEQGTRGC